MKKHIITIAGFPGSGKSSTAKGVARALGYEHLSSGDFFRKLGVELGLSVEETNIVAEKQKEIDKMVDNWLVSLGQAKSRMVIDSRTAFHWIPDSFKVFLDVDQRVAIERTFQQIQKEGRGPSQAADSVNELLEKTLTRVENEKKRYQSLYGIDVFDKSQFDLVVDTGSNNLETVINIIVSAYKQWLS